jgi:uncharacterized coiled-coil protein SlyX
MNKKIILSSITAISLLSSTLSGSSIDDKIAKLEQIIKAQQKQIDELKDTISNTANSEDLDEIDERLEEIETRSFTDKIQLGLGMRVEANNFSNTYANDTKYSSNEVYRTKLNINMKSKITDNMKFTGRLSMYKNWGDSTPRNYNMDSFQGRKPDSSAMYIERAYIDWIMNGSDAQIPLILTLGRQPSSDGPSYQIKEDMTRKGTYDALAADGAADGVVLTANLNNISKGTTLRVAYGTPNVVDNEQNKGTQFSYNGSNLGISKTRVTGVFLEQTLPNLSFGNLFQAYYMDASNLNANSQLLDINQSSPTFMQTQDKNLGDLTIAGAMVEVTKIGGKLDLFAHYARSEAKPNGNTVNMAGMGMTATEGLLTSTVGDTTSKTGSAYWLGARYALTKDYKFGAEYNHGSQNWFSFTSGANDPLNKLATRGDAWELYLTRKINKYANIRVGYVDINYDYTGSGMHIGAPTKITSAFGTNAIKETQNIYINFNLLF